MYPNEMRWACLKCQHEGWNSWPESFDDISTEYKSRSCPTCGNEEPYMPVAMRHGYTLVAITNGDLEIADTGFGETPIEAVCDIELGVNKDPVARAESDAPENRVKCDRCDAVIEAGSMVTAHASQPADGFDENEWALWEIYCEGCDIRSLIISSELSEDVLLQGRITGWGELFTLDDPVVIDDSPLGEGLPLGSP